MSIVTFPQRNEDGIIGYVLELLYKEAWMGLKRNVSLRDALRYQGKGPMLTFILHRISGLGIVLFVSLHILASFMMNQPWGAQAGVFINTIYEHWIFQIFIFFFVLFHVINGLRITLLDLWPKLIEYQREAIWLEWCLFLPIYGVAFYVLIRGGLGG
jgi:succinate dehydrogenase / fumarate reductase cytochrome b subunit